jgi:hypothetical protein
MKYLASYKIFESNKNYLQIIADILSDIFDDYNIYLNINDTSPNYDYYQFNNYSFRIVIKEVKSDLSRAMQIIKFGREVDPYDKGYKIYNKVLSMKDKIEDFTGIKFNIYNNERAIKLREYQNTFNNTPLIIYIKPQEPGDPNNVIRSFLIGSKDPIKNDQLDHAQPKKRPSKNDDENRDAPGNIE